MRLQGYALATADTRVLSQHNIHGQYSNGMSGAKNLISQIIG